MLMYRNNPLSLDSLAALTAANLPRCLESVAAVRERLPGLFAEGMKDSKAARILGALNTNSHEVRMYVAVCVLLYVGFCVSLLVGVLTVTAPAGC